MEPVFMVLGPVGRYGPAVLAMDANGSVQDVPYQVLEKRITYLPAALGVITDK